MQLRGLLAAVMACSTPPDEPAYAIVTKLAAYERHMAIDRDAGIRFAAGEMPDRFTVTMTTFSAGRQDSIFIRERRDGAWYSSSPSPGVIVDETPRIEPACDGCHADHAESLGMFTLHAVREASRLGLVARIECLADPTEPCDTAVYRDLRFD